MQPWIILRLELTGGRLRVRAVEAKGHELVPANAWRGRISRAALRGAGLDAQPEILVSEGWPIAAETVYAQLPKDREGLAWEPFLWDLMGGRLPVARYAEAGRAAAKPFALPLRIVAYNSTLPYLRQFLAHHWVSQAQGFGGLHFSSPNDPIRTFTDARSHVVIAPDRQLEEVLTTFQNMPAARRPSLLVTIPQDAPLAVGSPSIPAGTSLYRFGNQAISKTKQGLDELIHGVVHGLGSAGLLAGVYCQQSDRASNR
jgi:hypothetical protein